MSKTIDQRVVEMQFDNKNFEQNVSQSMSTLDKLKEKLSFKGASKAVDELNGAMGKVNTSVLEKAIDGVGNKFSALEQVAIGALRRIGDQVVNFAEQTIKSMSGIENMGEGWSKFGQETTAVATLKAQGYEIEKIEEQLELLNFFTDETSYEFTAMVGEIGKFTAAGQGLEESLTAMQGIATWAALSGQNAQTASRAMYQLSQAMGSGVMRKEDYKSIQNASMDTREFRQNAIDAALALGTLEEVSDGVYKSTVKDVKDGLFTVDQFAEHLTEDAWFTADVMMAVYKDYGKAALGIQSMMDNLGFDTASEAMADLEEKATKYAESLVNLGQAESVEAAMNLALQHVSLQEALSNSDAVDKAKAHMDEYNQSIIDTYNSTRTNGAAAISTVEEAAALGLEPIMSVEDSLVDMGYVIDELALKAFKAAQQARTWTDVVDSVKEAVASKWSKTFKTIIGDADEATELWTQLANDFYDLFAAGGDDRNDIFAIWRNWIDPKTREMLDAAKGIPSAVRDALAADAMVNGRDLLFSTDENNLGAIISLLNTIKTLLSTVKDAWNEIFYGTTDADEIAQQKADTLMSITKALKAFADAIAIDEVKGDKLRRTFKGLFAILDVIGTFIKTAFSAAWELLSSLFGQANGDILDTTAGIGDMLVKFRDWVKDSGVFKKAFDKVIGAVKLVIGAIKSLIDYVANLPVVSKVISILKTIFDEIKTFIGDFFKGLQEGRNIGDMFAEMFNKSEAVKKVKEFFESIWDAITTFWKRITNLKPKDSIVNDTIGQVFSGVREEFGKFVEYLGGAEVDFKGIMDSIKAIFSSITLDDIAVIAVAAVAIIFIYNLYKAVKKIGSIADAFTELAGSIGGLVKTLKSTIKANTIMFIAAAILSLVAALGVLAYLDPDRLYYAVTVLFSIVLIFSLLLIVVNSMKGIGASAIAIAGLAAALGVLALAMATIAKTDVGTLSQSAIILTLLGTWFLLIGALITQIASQTATIKSMIGTAILFVGMAGAMYIMVGAIRKLTTLDLSNIDKVSDLMLKMMLGMALVTAGAKLMGKGGTFAIISAAASLFLVISAIKKLAQMVDEDYQGTMDGLQMIEHIFRIFGDTLAKIGLFSFGKGMKGAGTAAVGLSLSLWIIIGIIQAIAKVPYSDLQKGEQVINGIMSIMALVVAASAFSGENASKAGTMLIKMSVAIGLLSLVIWGLSMLPAEGMTRAASVVEMITGIFAVVLAVSGLAKDSTKAITMIMVTLIALSAVIIALSLIDTGHNVIAAAQSLALVLAALALVFTTTKFTKDVSKDLLTIAIAIGLVGVILATMSFMPIQNSIQNAIALSVLMLALSASLVIISKFTNLGTENLLAGVIAVGGIMVALGLVLALMGLLPTGSAIINALAISILLTVMTGVLLLISNFAKGNAGAIVSIAILSKIVAELALVLGLMSAFEVGDALNNAIALSILLLAMSAVMLLMIPIGAAATLAIAGLALMIKFVTVLGVFVGALGAIVEQFPFLEEFVNKGMDLLATLGFGIGNFIGSIVAGLAQGATSSLPVVADNLAAFGTRIGPFIEMVNSLKDDDLSGLEMITNFMNASVALAAVDTSVLTVFGTRIENFGAHIKGFYEQTKGIDDTSKLAQITEIAHTLVDIGNMMPRSGGWIDDIIGTADMEKFSEGITSFIEAVLQINSVLAGQENTIDLDAINIAVEAGRMFTGLAENLPKHGGFWQSLIGDNNLTDFANDMLGFAPKIKRVAEILSAGDPIDTEKVETAVNAASMFTGLAEHLPKHSGFWQDLAGDNNLTDFANDMLGFAPKIKRVAEILSAGDPINEQSVSTAAHAANIFSALANNLPKTGGIVQFFAGSSISLTEFATDIYNLGVGIKDFSDQVIGINSGAVTTATTALDVLATLANKLPETKGIFGIFTGGEADIEGFKKMLPKFAEGVREFSRELSKDGGINSTAVSAAASSLSSISALGQIGDFAKVENVVAKLPGLAENVKKYNDIIGNNDSFYNNNYVLGVSDMIKTLQETENELYYTDYGKITAAFTKIESLTYLINTMSKTDTEKIDAFGEAMKSLGEGGIADFLKAFQNETSGLEDAGIIVLNSLVRGVTTNENIFSQAFLDLADLGTSAIRSKYDDFKAAGEHITEGLTSGISEKEEEAQSSGGLFDNITSLFSGETTSNVGTEWLSNINLDVSNLNIGEFKADLLGSDGLGFDTSSIGTEWLGNINLDISNLNIDEFKTAFLGSDGLGFDVSSVGTDWINSLTGSMSSEKSTTDLEESGKATANTFITGYKSKFDDIKQVGTFSIDGLVKAIKDKSSEVQTAGEEIAKALTTGMELTLKIASPSKVMYSIGEFAGQGFVNALTNYVDVSANAGEDIATAATDSLRDALAQSAAAFDTSVDVQPTIRPVLDLSNIDEGIGQLDGMFDANRSIALAGSANLAMEAATGDIQNEIKVDNSDVVTAITDLQTDMADMVDKITNMQIYLDKNVLVGQMAAPMDKALGTNYRRNLRQ